MAEPRLVPANLPVQVIKGSAANELRGPRETHRATDATRKPSRSRIPSNTRGPLGGTINSGRWLRLSADASLRSRREIGRQQTTPRKQTQAQPFPRPSWCLRRVLVHPRQPTISASISGRYNDGAIRQQGNGMETEARKYHCGPHTIAPSRRPDA